MAEIISFEDWKKMDLRVGKVLEVGDHPNADKLFVLKVDMGGETRRIVAGMRPYYAANELVGKNVVVFVNLKPVELRGIVSEGMVLAAEKDGKVVLLGPEKDVGAGALVR